MCRVVGYDFVDIYHHICADFSNNVIAYNACSCESVFNPVIILNYSNSNSQSRRSLIVPSNFDGGAILMSVFIFRDY